MLYRTPGLHHLTCSLSFPEQNQDRCLTIFPVPLSNKNNFDVLSSLFIIAFFMDQELLSTKNVIPDLLQTAFPAASALSTSLKPADPQKITREAAIWAIGCIATSEAGLALLTAHRPEVLLLFPFLVFFTLP